MKKVITHIDCPKEWESENDWDSHRELLWLALQKINGLVIECGCGYGSTLLLDKYCKRFVSYETNKEWFDKLYLDVPYSLLWVNDWDDVESRECHLLFMDCAPGEIRKHLIKKWEDNASVIVVHDTEPGAEYVYGMSEVLSSFKYRLDYQPEGKPYTTAVSNYIDVTSWC